VLSTKDALGTEALQEVFVWSMEQIKKEVARLTALKVTPIEVQVIDMSVLVQNDKQQFNRVVFNTEFDFSQVRSLLISPTVPVPNRAGFQYVNVLLLAKGKPDSSPIIFPYVFKGKLRKELKKNAKNTLKHWILVNNKCEEAYH